MRADDFIPVSTRAAQVRPASAREWLRQFQPQLSRLNPRRHRPPLATDGLRNPDGSPVDVMRHFDVNPRTLQKLLFNFFGLSHTAQLVGAGYAAGPRPVWPGFEQVWIPVAPDLSLSGWIAFARREGRIIDANCIVLLPGLLGCNDILRTRDLAHALLAAGHHVLAVELRGHGMTDWKYPDVYYTFGVMETADLLRVSQWLDDQPHVLGSGLIGFCWGANHAVLAAWCDGRSADDSALSPILRNKFGPPAPRRHFTAGVMAFSGAWRFDEICEQLEKPRSYWDEPVSHALQQIVMGRAAAKNHPHPGGSLYKLIADEFRRSELDYPEALQDAYNMVRFFPHRGSPVFEKLSSIRVPTLIVSAANDPMTGGQPLADLIATSENPHVAALITEGGGHNGFAAWSRSFYFSLILNFYDRQTGPAAQKTCAVGSD